MTLLGLITTIGIGCIAYYFLDLYPIFTLTKNVDVLYYIGIIGAAYSIMSIVLKLIRKGAMVYFMVLAVALVGVLWKYEYATSNILQENMYAHHLEIAKNLNLGKEVFLILRICVLLCALQGVGLLI